VGSACSEDRTGDRLRRKLVVHARLAARSEAPDAIALLFPGEKRERGSAPKLCIDIGIPVLTSHRELYFADPLGAVWLPVRSERRASLLHLSPGAKRVNGRVLVALVMAIPQRSRSSWVSSPAGAQSSALFRDD
jgi:hypothetical protein